MEKSQAKRFLLFFNKRQDENFLYRGAFLFLFSELSPCLKNKTTVQQSAWRFQQPCVHSYIALFFPVPSWVTFVSNSCLLKWTLPPVTVCVGRRMEDFLNTKLDRRVQDRETNYEAFGQAMIEAGNDLGPGTQYGKPSKVQFLVHKILTPPV